MLPLGVGEAARAGVGARVADRLERIGTIRIDQALHADQRARIATLADKLALPLTRIGRIQDRTGLRVLDEDDREVSVPARGWQHF